MANVILTEASSGAPTLSGVNGTLCAVLDWALVQNGWAIEFTATNQRVYRPGTGNRHRLYVAHDSTVSGNVQLATVRGCESATAAAAASIVDPFPTVAQTANASSTVCVSQTASALARGYRIIVGTNFVVIAINTGTSNVGSWEIFAFGDFGADSYATAIWVGNASSTGTGNRSMLSTAANYPASSGKVYWCRTVDGASKSCHGALVASGSGLTSLCSVAGTPVMRSGYANRIVREKIAVSDNGSTTSTAGPLSQHKRGWLPFVWNPVHTGIGAVTSDDTFTDTTYSASAAFMIVPASATLAVILETTDTWSAPSG